MEIKKEDHLSVDVGSQNQGEFFTNRVQLKSNSGCVLSENDGDVVVKSEAPFLDFCSQNERENLSRHLLNEIRPETIKCSNICEIDIKIENGSEKEREFLAQNCTILKVENYNSDHHIDSKIEIKEEPCWPLETETSSVCDENIRDEDFTPVKSPRCNRAGETRITSDLFSNEDFGNYTTFSMTNDRPECKRAIKCQSQRTGVTHTSSIEKSICLEAPDGGKIVSMACFCKQNNLLQEGNTSKLVIDKNYKSALNNAYKTLYKCDICQNSFKYSFHLKSHKLVKNTKEVNKYVVAEKRFAQLRNLKRLKLIHEGIKPHKCNTCNKAFTDLSTLKTHTLIHQGIKPHKCNICSKAFTQLQQLKTHTLIHEGIKPHACDICNKAFTDLSGLKKHKLIHEGIKPHNCNICNKSFTHLSNLKRHKLIHEGIKPHKCYICNKAFTDLSTLKRHTLIHGDIKPHKCDICNRSFTDLSTLKRHKVIHENIKPHKCNLCSKAFSRLHLLKRHKLIHEEKKTTVM